MRMKSSFCAVMLFGFLAAPVSACDESNGVNGVDDVRSDDEAGIECVLPPITVPGTRPPGSGFNPSPTPPMPPPGSPAPGGGSPAPASLVDSVEDLSTNCNIGWTHRFLIANEIARPYVENGTARRGDTIAITLNDGNREVWEFRCHGSACAIATNVLEEEAQSSDCD